MITSLIGGLQMFDVPQILTNGQGSPNNTTKTLIMYLNEQIGTSKNYGMAGALSVNYIPCMCGHQPGCLLLLRC